VIAQTPAERERLEDCLEEANIETEHYYPRILSEQPVYQSGQLPSIVAGDLAVSRHLAACETCLPIYPELLPEEQERVITAVKRAFTGNEQLANTSVATASELIGAVPT
jgi:dTDP-4-amino-4,6-dideoxygalactose transaminase